MNKRIILLAALALAAVACGDDDGEEGPPVILRPDGGGVQNPIDAGGLDATVTPTNDGSVDSGQPTNPVKGAPGCFSGTPTTSKDFLNSCAEGYVDFNDTQRLPGYTGGRATIPN